HLDDRSQKIVELFLSATDVEGTCGARQPQSTVERNASAGIGHGNCGRIDAQTEGTGPDCPMGRRPARCKGEHFERMTLRIAKFERRHPAWGWRQNLRAIS